MRQGAKLEQARELRRHSTRAEKFLWEVLRAKRLNGHKFVRQAPIGPFIADFASRDRMLIVEIDGETHSTEDELARDARRTAYLRREGYRVIRFWNSDVIEAMDGVIVTILMALKRPPPLAGEEGDPSPKATGGGEGH